MARSRPPNSVNPVCADDFVGNCASAGTAGARLSQQSQVDRLITDLMDIIVRGAAASSGRIGRPLPQGNGTTEQVALLMMQALLERDVCSSF